MAPKTLFLGLIYFLEQLILWKESGRPFTYISWFILTDITEGACAQPEGRDAWRKPQEGTQSFHAPKHASSRNFHLFGSQKARHTQSLWGFMEASLGRLEHWPLRTPSLVSLPFSEVGNGLRVQAL